MARLALHATGYHKVLFPEGCLDVSEQKLHAPARQLGGLHVEPIWFLMKNKRKRTHTAIIQVLFTMATRVTLPGPAGRKT